MRLVIEIQSFSDVITNSSSELFVCTSTDTERAKEAILALFNYYDKTDQWNYSGDARGVELYTIVEAYNNMSDWESTFHIAFESTDMSKAWKVHNYDEIVERFPQYIRSDSEGIFLDKRLLTLEEYIEFESLYDEEDYTENSLFLYVDYGNRDFVGSLESLGLKFKCVQ